MLRGGAERRLAIGFEIKHFTPEQLTKLSIRNPNLFADLGLETGKSVSDAEYLEAQRELTETWTRLEAAYAANTEAIERLEKAKKGPPLATPVQLLGALMFLLILIRIIGGS